MGKHSISRVIDQLCCLLRSQATPTHPKPNLIKMDPAPLVHSIFDKSTGTWQYLVADPATRKAAVIDSVLDFDPATQKVTTDNADAILRLIESNNYQIQWILETHIHADHLTAAAYLQGRLAGQQQDGTPRIGIGKRITQVQKTFAGKYNVSWDECEGVFDKMFDDDEEFPLGNLKAQAIHLPGHTPDLMGYVFGDNVFCGDSIFHADIGTARCDFPGGSAKQLYQSAQKLLAMADHVKIWTGHDYPSGARQQEVPFLTASEHRDRNKHLANGTSEEQYVAVREGRDAQMAEPRLIHQALQVNIRGGRMPKASSQSGLRMLHVPLKLGALDAGKGCGSLL